MFKDKRFNDVVNEQLTAATEEIFGDFTRAVVEDEAEIKRQRRMLDIIWKPHIHLHRIDALQQHVCKEEQQLCHQERKSSLDQEDPEPPEIKEEQEEEPIKQEETDALMLIPTKVEDVLQQHVCKAEEVEPEQQLCHQERKSSPDQEDPEPPQIKQEQEEVQLKQEETEMLILTPAQEETIQSEANGQNEHQLLSHNSRIAGNQDPKENKQKDSEMTSKFKPRHETGRKHTDENSYQHVHIHTDTKLYTCGICGKSFTHKCSLSNHFKIHTGEKPYTCTTCNKCFRHKSTLTIHMRTHTGENPFSCSTCGKRFSTASNLSTHILTHTGTKLYTCGTCGQSFTLKCTLDRHLKIHTGEKPYTCTVCNKCFSQKSALTVHMRTHTGENPFSCSTCGKRFSTRSNLNTHIRTHTGTKPFT